MLPQVASRVAPQAASAQGALLGQARPQMAMQYVPQQQLPVLEVSFSATSMQLLIGNSVLQPRCCDAVCMFLLWEFWVCSASHVVTAIVLYILAGSHGACPEMDHQISKHQSATVDLMLDWLNDPLCTTTAAMHVRPGAVMHKMIFDPDTSMPFAFVCFMQCELLFVCDDII